ncbi:MAG: hypothetical protein ACI83I_001902 [Bacteroidia bacterium]
MNIEATKDYVNAVPAHLGLHGGCTLGACDVTCDDNKSYKDGGAEADIQHIVYDENEMDLVVFPNPSTCSFNFILESPFDDLVTLEVNDFSGRLITHTNNLMPNDEHNFDDNLPMRMYIAVVKQGELSKTFKNIKQ